MCTVNEFYFYFFLEVWSQCYQSTQKSSQSFEATATTTTTAKDFDTETINMTHLDQNMTNLVESNNNNADDDYDAEVIDSRSVTNQSQDKRTVVGEDDGDLQDHGTQESSEIYF